MLSERNSLIGPRFARFKDFFKYFVPNNNSLQFGHDPKAALLYLVLYSAILLLILTGITMAGVEHNMGPLALFTFDRLILLDYLREPHELASYFILFFVIIHIGALLYHQNKTKLPLIRTMFDGVQHRYKKNGD